MKVASIICFILTTIVLQSTAQESAVSPMDHSAQHSKEMLIKVIEKESFEPISFATIVVEYVDTIIGGMADTDGIYSFVPQSLPLNLKVSGFGMKESIMKISTLSDSIVTVALSPGAIELQEVAVIGRLINQTNSGISYNMAANRRA